MPQMPRQAPQKSLRVAQKEQAAAQMANMGAAPDLGLLDETFVTPSLRNYPSPLKSPRTFASVLWRHVRLRFRDRLSLFILWASSPRDKANWRFWNRQFRAQRRQIPPAAASLHRQMYAAFARGDVHVLRKTCTDGIFVKFKTRIANRARNERFEWALVKYLGKPQLVSYRGARFPGEGGAVVQAVVRIKSRQRLTRFVGDTVVPGSGKEKDVVENVVCQRITRNWKQGPWQVWGTTSDTTSEDLRAWDIKAGRIDG